MSLDLLIFYVARPHSDTQQSVGLLWPSDQSHAETSDCQHTTVTRDRNLPPPRAGFGFEPAVPAIDWPWNHNLDRAVTGICN
jgi:hypothetical protein